VGSRPGGEFAAIDQPLLATAIHEANILVAVQLRIQKAKAANQLLLSP
jgi:hypothetical protein